LSELEQRRRAVQTALAGDKSRTLRADALLVSSPANLRYLTGYAGSNGLALVTPSDTHFFTDPRYAIEATQNITCKVHIAKGPLGEAAAAIVQRRRLKKIGFEPAWLNVEQHLKLKNLLPSGVSLQPLPGIVENLRMIKSAEEIEQIRRSVHVNSEAYGRTLRRVRLGMREQDVAAELDYQMRIFGAEKSAFDTIVAAGTRTALPHSQPTAKRLEENDLLLIDMGASLDGYMSDMTRMAFLGFPNKRIKTLYGAVLEAQLAAIDSVRPGVTATQVDAAARGVLKRHGLDRQFVHSTGHGLGLEIHEGPRIGKKDPTTLAAGMAITIEPGAYLEGLGGIRIEDTVLVTASGCEVLTPTTKEFVHL
jgi:Xaa-Pro aminopeptidase